MKTQRNTLQKKIILDVLKEFDDHPSVEDVYAKVKSAYPTISKNTVYRNLRLLAENGKIKKVSLPGEQERYDNLTDEHYHFQCKICGLISDVQIKYLGDIDDTVQQKYGLQIDEHEIVFRGTCSQCRK